MQFEIVEVPTELDSEERFPVKRDLAFQYSDHTCDFNRVKIEPLNESGKLKQPWQDSQGRNFPKGALVIGWHKSKLKNSYLISTEIFKAKKHAIGTHPACPRCSCTEKKCFGRLLYSAVTGWECQLCGKRYGWSSLVSLNEETWTYRCFSE